MYLLPTFIFLSINDALSQLRSNPHSSRGGWCPQDRRVDGGEARLEASLMVIKWRGARGEKDERWMRIGSLIDVEMVVDPEVTSYEQRR